MNGIRRKSIPQEIMEYEYNGEIKSYEDESDVVNFYNQLKGGDELYSKNGRFVQGY